MIESEIRSAFHRQAVACRNLDSPFTARLLQLLADRLDKGTTVGSAILNWPRDPVADALALRLTGAFHALVLAKRREDLVAVYPPHLDANDEQLWLAVRNALESEAAEIIRFIQGPPQTNEVARSASLAGGFLTIAALTSLPLALLEIGASAGLNLHWDSFGYDLGGLGHNKASGRPLLSPTWQGPSPPAAEVIVSERAGCDRSPINRHSRDDVLRLRAYTWPDQTQRLERLDQALATTRSSSISIDHANAADWVQSRLSKRREGVVTVLFHSIVWQYIAKEEQKRLQNTIEQAGKHAQTNAPFAWMRMEPETTNAAALRLTLWPDWQTQYLADVDYHGRWINWLIEPTTLRPLLDG